MPSYPETITVDGYDGTPFTDNDQLYGRLDRETAAQFPDGATEEQYRRWRGTRLGELLAAQSVAAHHNKLVEPYRDWMAARTSVRRAVRAADDAYAELEQRTTTAWLAARHRFTQATITAGEAHTALVAATRTLAVVDEDRDHFVVSHYDILVRPAQRITLPALDEIVLEQTGFMERSTERFALLNCTVLADYPPGFAPAPPTLTVQPGDPQDAPAERRPWDADQHHAAFGSRW